VSSPVRYALIYLFVAAIVAAGAWQITGLKQYLALSEAGVAVKGVVLRTDCENHQSYSFSFQAGEHWVQGSATGETAQACKDLKAGDPVDVTYLPADPAVHATGSVHERLANEETSALLLILLAPAVITFRIAWAISQRQARGRA
jgi:hypothetical protein